MNFFQRVGKFLKGVVKFRKTELKPIDKDLGLAPGTLEGDANALTPALVDAGVAAGQNAVEEAVAPNTLPPTLAEIVAKEVSGGMQ